MIDVEKILRMREGGAVRRCHTLPHHGHYDNAQHSFNMLLLLDELNPGATLGLYKHILRHDLFERWTGDAPCMSKMLIPELREGLARADEILAERTGIEMPTLEPHERLWLKALDWIEFLMWCDEQIGLGYIALIPKRQTVIDGLNEMDIPTECRDFLGRYSWRRTDDVVSARTE